MSQTTYESSIKTISSSEEVVFAMLSNLNNIEKIKDKLPQDKLEGLEFDADSVRFQIEALGQIGFRVVDREPYKTVKFESEKIPMPIHVWIQLKQVAENDTRMKLTLKADLPFFIKKMVDEKLKEGVEQIANMLAMIPYN